MSYIEELTRANILLNSKSGRDKLYKTMQYLLKLVIEFAHLGKIEHPWLPPIKRFSLRLSQSRALFRLGAFLSDFERLEILAKSGGPSWDWIERLLTGFTVFVSNLFDSVVCVNGIVRRDTSWSLHYSTLFWLLGIFGDMIRCVRGLARALQAEARWRKLKRADPNPSSHPSSPPETIDIGAVRESKQENFIGIVKTACDSVTALSILYPVSIGKYRLFVCSCGLLAGSIGLVQNWNTIKAK